MKDDDNDDITNMLICIDKTKNKRLKKIYQKYLDQLEEDEYYKYERREDNEYM